jgi:calcineurin-like phosphoesterase family protein
LKKFNTKNNKIWFSSDIHHFHKNLCFGETRWDNPELNCRMFDTTKEMSQHMIKQLNKYIGEDDIFFFLGDWSFGGIENIWNLRKQLKVKIIYFIIGNHDHHIKRNKILPNCHYKDLDDNDILILDGPDELYPVNAKDLFTEVHNYLEIVVDGRTVMLFHRPIEDFHDQRGKVIHLHGHSHGNCPIKPNRLDVGLDNAYKLFGEYRPFDWDDILRNI